MKLVMGHVHIFNPDGNSYVPNDDAIIHFDGDEISDIRVQCPDALSIANLIVLACNSHAANEAKIAALVKALEEVRDFMMEDVHSGDNALWSIGYSEIFDVVEEALAMSSKELGGK